MAETIQFDRFSGNRKPQCIACDEMLADALDGTLSDADQAWFDAHVSTCAGCSQHMAEAQRGAAWLEMLKSPRPEPSAQLMERILAQTSGSAADQFAEQPSAAFTLPSLQPATVLPVRPARILPFRIPLPRLNATWLEPRLAMTAAMAFFSVALTLNLTGVKLDQLHASDLKPTNLKRTYFEANAEVSRYYENLRVVRVMESRVDDLRQANDDEEAEPQQQKPAAQPAPKQEKPQPGPGSSRRETPLADPRGSAADRKLRRTEAAISHVRPNTLEGGLA